MTTAPKQRGGYTGEDNLSREDDRGWELIGGVAKQDAVQSPTFPDLRIELASVFDFPLEPGEPLDLIKEPRVPYPCKGTLV